MNTNALDKFAKEDEYRDVGMESGKKAAVRALSGSGIDNDGYAAFKTPEAMKRTGKGQLEGGAIGGASLAALGALLSKKNKGVGALAGGIGGLFLGSTYGGRKAEQKMLKEKGIDQSFFGFKTKMKNKAIKKYLRKYEQ